MSDNDNSRPPRFGVAQARDWSAMADDEFRAFIYAEFDAAYPEHLRHPPRRLLWSEQRDFYLDMARRGWIAPAWPAEFGGMGLEPAKLLIFFEEQERLGIARFQDHGVRMVGPALIQHGTVAQQEAFLPPILSCEHRYCQGYSEPEAGSDLASLRTTARRVDGGWAVNGTKIWTTMAYDVTHMFLLARTGAEGRAQTQISFFLLDLTTPGITIRKIRDIAGEDELSEVFLDDVLIPAENLVGGVNRGWTVAKSVLGFERMHVGSPQLPESGLHMLARVAEARDLLDDPSFRDRFAALRLDVDHLAIVYENCFEKLQRGAELGPDVSMLKLWATETFQRIADLVIEIAGPAGGAAGSVHAASPRLSVTSMYYRARPSTIYGGSSEVQRNIIAKQVLKLPTS
jgi:alkylation response protein AidB-like acyl-CoA dehydrogenase